MKVAHNIDGALVARDRMVQTMQPDGAWELHPNVRRMKEPLSGAGRCVAARAPGRLDVIGGFSDDAGASVVYLPIAVCAHVSGQQRNDAKVVIADLTSPSAATHEPLVIDFVQLRSNLSTLQSICALRTNVAQADPNGAFRAVLGSLTEMLRDGLIEKNCGGFSIGVHAGEAALACCGRNAAISVATLAVLGALFEVDLDASCASQLASRAERNWFDMPVGAGDAACAWSGPAGMLGTFHGESHAFGGALALPSGAKIIGLHCGKRHDDAAEKFRHARVAASMGSAVIGRIRQAQVEGAADRNGWLAGIGVDDYVDRYRDRVPTRMRGVEFLDRMGSLNDECLRIDPKKTYKVRSRTEHHIYEQVRSVEFMSLAARATEETTDELLCAMGEVMYGSHWSYGQRCGLGSIETDLLVNLIRQRGPASGLYGARVSGRGCGGVVVVLLGNSDSAEQSLSQCIDDYSNRTGYRVTRLEGSIPGVSSGGVREL